MPSFYGIFFASVLMEAVIWSDLKMRALLLKPFLFLLSLSIFLNGYLFADEENDVYVLNQQLVRDGQLIPEMPSSEVPYNLMVTDQYGTPVGQYDGVTYTSLQDGTLKQGYILHVGWDGNKNPIPIVSELSDPHTLISKTLDADEIKTLAKNRDAKMTIEELLPPKFFFNGWRYFAYYNVAPHTQGEPNRKAYFENHKHITYLWRGGISGDVEVRKVAIVKLLAGSPSSPIVEIKELGSNGRIIDRFLNDSEIKSVKPLYVHFRVPFDLQILSALSNESYIDANGNVVKPGSILAGPITQNSLEIPAGARLISLSIEDDNGTVEHRIGNGSTIQSKINLGFSYENSPKALSGAVIVSEFMRVEERKRMLLQELPEGNSWRVIEKIDHEKGGEGACTFIAVRKDTSKMPHAFEGELPELIARYPEFAQKMGFRYENGQLSYPNAALLNAFLKGDPNSNGLTFSEGASGKEATDLDYISLLADRKVVWAAKGVLHFHDIGIHGIGYILMPRELVDVQVSKARLLLELFNEVPLIRENRVFLDEVRRFVKSFDNFSGNISLGLRVENANYLSRWLNIRMDEDKTFYRSARDMGNRLLKSLHDSKEVPSEILEKVRSAVDQASDIEFQPTDTHIDSIFKRLNSQISPTVRNRAQKTPSKEQEAPRTEEKSRTDRGQIDLRLLGVPSREALVENGSSLAKILLAEEIKELYFSITNWDSQRIVAYNQKLIENPVEMLASLEGFVLTEKAAQKALGFQNGQALDIRFLEKWPTVHKFAMALKRHLPMAVAMGVMESLRKISERKDLLEGLEKADLIEQELFYVEVNNAILQSVMLYANASCDVLSDPETYKIISRKVGQFVAAGNVVYYGKKVAQWGRRFCQGAKVRTAVEAGSLTLPGFAVATLDLAATMVVEEYLNGMVDRFIRWWEEWGYIDNIRRAQDHILHFKKDPQIDDPLPAIQNLKYRIQEYEDYLMKDVKLALLSGEMGAKKMEDYYSKRIENIKNRRPHQRPGKYVVEAMGKSITQSGEIEESYEKTKTGWRIRRVAVIDGKTSEGATGYWGAVGSPAQFQEMTDEEFSRYTEDLIQRAERDKIETASAIREAAKKNALSITDKVYEVISPVIREQIDFLEAQFPQFRTK